MAGARTTSAEAAQTSWPGTARSMPFVSSGGVRIYYEEAGQGQPLILVAGQQIDHTFW